MTARVEIVRASALWRAIPRFGALARKAVAAALAESGAEVGRGAEVAILLCDDARVRELNARWRGKDQTTNVLSFPAARTFGAHEAARLGDIALAFETVSREAANEAKAPRDHALHLVVHGFLHLLGYGHATPTEAKSMETLEARALARLGIGDPYRELDKQEAAR